MNVARTVQRTLTKPMLMDEQLFAAEKGRNLPLRVVFLSLHLIADRNGNFDWSSQLARFLLPDDEKKVRLSLEALVELAKVVKYKDGDESVYGHISDFSSTQHINNREMTSSRPVPYADGCLAYNLDGTWSKFSGPALVAPKPTQPTEKRGRGRPKKVVVDAQIQRPAPIKDDTSPAPKAAVALATEQTSLILVGESKAVSAGGPRFVQYGTGKTSGLHIRFDEGEVNGVLVDDAGDMSPKAIGMLKPCRVVGHEFKVYLSQAIMDHFNAMYQVNNVLRVNRATAWIEENPTKTKTLVGLKRFFGGWIARAHNNNQDIVQLDGDGFATGATRMAPTGRADIEVVNIAAQASSQIRNTFINRRAERRS